MEWQQQKSPLIPLVQRAFGRSPPWLPDSAVSAAPPACSLLLGRSPLPPERTNKPLVSVKSSAALPSAPLQYNLQSLCRANCCCQHRAGCRSPHQAPHHSHGLASILPTPSAKRASRKGASCAQAQEQGLLTATRPLHPARGCPTSTCRPKWPRADGHRGRKGTHPLPFGINTVTCDTGAVGRPRRRQSRGLPGHLDSPWCGPGPDSNILRWSWRT